MSESMQWSIYLETKHEMDFEDTGICDYRTEVPDGVYDVYFPYIQKIGKGCGVIVQDGRFAPEPTIAAITDARDMVNYWGVYIEDLMWDEQAQAFTVSIGS